MMVYVAKNADVNLKYCPFNIVESIILNAIKFSITDDVGML